MATDQGQYPGYLAEQLNMLAIPRGGSFGDDMRNKPRTLKTERIDARRGRYMKTSKSNSVLNVVKASKYPKGLGPTSSKVRLT